MIARPMPLEGIASNQRVVEEVIEGGKHFEAPVTTITGFALPLAISRALFLAGLE